MTGHQDPDASEEHHDLAEGDHPPGERAVPGRIAVRDGDGGDDALDWLDAAVLSCQVARNAAEDCTAVLRPGS